MHKQPPCSAQDEIRLQLFFNVIVCKQYCNSMLQAVSMRSPCKHRAPAGAFKRRRSAVQVGDLVLTWRAHVTSREDSSGVSSANTTAMSSAARASV